MWCSGEKVAVGKGGLSNWRRVEVKVCMRAMVRIWEVKGGGVVKEGR